MATIRRGLLALVAVASTTFVIPAALAQNIVPDPAFQNGVAAWTPHNVLGNFAMTFVPSFSKRPGSGSALFSYSGASGGNFSICVPVVGGASYDFGYSMFFPDPNRVAGLNENFAQFSGAGCTGSAFGSSVLPIFPPQTNAWVTSQRQVPMAATSRSVEIGISAFGTGGAQPLAYLDDVVFGISGTISSIDPPPPIPALAPWGLAALSGALALAAGRALRG